MVEPSAEPVALVPDPDFDPDSNPRADEALPEYVVDPSTVPEPIALVPVPEPEDEVPAGPLPEYVVDPEAEPVEPVEPVEPAEPVVPTEPVALVPAPEPLPDEEEEVDLGPLPEYVLDPDRPAGAEGSSESPSEPSPFADLGIRAPTFPVPETTGEAREGDEDVPRRSHLSRTSPAESDQRRSRSSEEPGDETAEVGWMQGLSNRLSAYSLSQEDAGPAEPEEGDAEADTTSEDDDTT